jgi:hypothetical protein
VFGGGKILRLHTFCATLIPAPSSDKMGFPSPKTRVFTSMKENLLLDALAQFLKLVALGIVDSHLQR